MFRLQDHDRIRALVNAEEVSADQEPPTPSGSKNGLRYLRFGLAGLIVLGSIVVAGWLVLSELGSDSDEQPVSTSAPVSDPTAVPSVAPTEAPASEPTVAPVSTDPGEAFTDLRYLPAGAVPGLDLLSILRSPDALPIAAFTRSDRNDRVSGILLVDMARDGFVDGVGVPELSEVAIGDQTGVIASTGPTQSHVVAWEDPNLGHVRAWGIGMTAIEQAAIVDQLSARIDTSDQDASLPLGWQQVANYGGTDFRPLWRASYIGDTGEVVVITTSASPVVGDADDCPTSSDTATTCDTIDAQIDNDGVEVALLAAPSRIETFRARLRPSSLSNARVRSMEIEPFAHVEASEAAQLLYLPDSSDGWEVTESLTYASTQVVSEPALVLFERDTPEIGAIVSGVVVQRVPDEIVSPEALASTESATDQAVEATDDAAGEEDPAATAEGDETTAEGDETTAEGDETSSDEAETPADAVVDAEDTDESPGDSSIIRLVTRKSGIDYELLAWNHFPLELGLVETLLTVDEAGLGYASRAGESIGLERQYESAILNPNPRVRVEGAVFSARLVNELGAESTIRVSRVPGFVPEASVVQEHENSPVLVSVRGKTAALVVLNGSATLQWEEEPGRLITLSGPDEAELLELADSLELVRASVIADQ